MLQILLLKAPIPCRVATDHCNLPSCNIRRHKTNHFAIFTADKSDSVVSASFQDDTKLLGFINRTNESNSGVAEYLCDYVMTLMSGLTGSEAELNWRRRWPAGLRTIALDAVTLIEDELLEYLHHEHRANEPDNRFDQRIKFEVLQDLKYPELNLLIDNE